jgi:nicotinate-nucleotide adenylyltransferase
MKKKIGVFGGSFNPIHVGHCVMVENFINSMNLDECILIPTFISPFKQNQELSTTQLHPTPHQRLSMVKIIARTNPKINVSDWEIRRGVVSYSIDTIKYLRSLYPNDELYLLIGQDQAESFTKWKDYEQILENVTLCVAGRVFDNTVNKKEYDFPTIQLKTPIIEVSSSGIRNDILIGNSVKYRLHDKVLRFVKQHHLYKANKSIKPNSTHASKDVNDE